MKKIFYLLLIAIFFINTNSFGLTEADYMHLLNTSEEFRMSDARLNKSWEEINKNLSPVQKKELLNIHRQWVKKGRDEVAEEYMQMGYTKDCAYAKATRRWTKNLEVIVHNLNLSQNELNAGHALPDDYLWEEVDDVIPAQCKDTLSTTVNKNLNAAVEIGLVGELAAVEGKNEFNTNKIENHLNNKVIEQNNETEIAKNKEVSSNDEARKNNIIENNDNNSEATTKVKKEIGIYEKIGGVIFLFIIVISMILMKLNKLVIYADKTDVALSGLILLSPFLVGPVVEKIFGESTLGLYLAYGVIVILLIISFIYSYRSNINSEYGIFAVILSFITKISLILISMLLIAALYFSGAFGKKYNKTRRQSDREDKKLKETLANALIHNWVKK